MSQKIPKSFMDLVNGPPVAALPPSCQMVSRKQRRLVRFRWDLCTHQHHAGFRKEKNMRLNPKVTFFVTTAPDLALYRNSWDRGRDDRGRGAGAPDGLSELYTGRSPYFGECVPVELKQIEVPVLCKIKPDHIVPMDARKSREAGLP